MSFQMILGRGEQKIILKMDQKEISMLEDQLRLRPTMNGCQSESSRIKEESLESLELAN